MSDALIACFAVGIALILIEVITPGGILGAIGGVSMLIGTLIAFREYGPAGGFAALGVAIGVLALGLFIEFRILPRTRLGKKLFLSAAVTGRSTPDTASAGTRLIGLAGEAVTALAPTGIVQVENHRFEAASRSGFIERGERVVVRGGSNFQLIVEKQS